MTTQINTFFNTLKKRDKLLILYEYWSDIEDYVNQFIINNFKKDELFLAIADHDHVFPKDDDKVACFFPGKDQIHFTSKVNEMYSHASSKGIILKVFINVNNKGTDVFEYLKAIIKKISLE